MVADKENYIYIVAGDEMARLMGEKHTERRIIPFRGIYQEGAMMDFPLVLILSENGQPFGRFLPRNTLKS